MNYMNSALRPNAQRAKLALIFLGLVLVFETIAIASGVLQYRLLEGMALGNIVTDAQLEANDLRERIVTIAYLFVLLLSGITFILWFRRSYYNLHLKADLLSYSEGWAAGGWFVPFINWVRPYRIMKELHLETNNLIRKNDGNVPRSHSGSLIDWWWGLWILNSFVANIGFRLYPNPQTIDEFLNSTTASIIVHIVGIPVAIVTMVLIVKQSQQEMEFSRVFTRSINEQPDNQHVAT